jgi:hypothetical protein
VTIVRGGPITLGDLSAQKMIKTTRRMTAPMIAISTR